MVNLLAGEELDNGLRAALPPDVLVAHKTGNWTNAPTTPASCILQAPPT
jgi:hypothetical protein